MVSQFFTQCVYFLFVVVDVVVGHLFADATEQNGTTIKTTIITYQTNRWHLYTHKRARTTKAAKQKMLKKKMRKNILYQKIFNLILTNSIRTNGSLNLRRKPRSGTQHLNGKKRRPETKYIQIGTHNDMCHHWFPLKFHQFNTTFKIIVRSDEIDASHIYIIDRSIHVQEQGNKQH